LWVGRWLTLVWTAVLVAGAMAFRNQNTPVVQLALSIASITYGGLLGTYLLGGLWPRARERDVIAAIIISVLVMTPIVLGVPWRLLPGLAWPWYVPLGTAVTVSVGMAASMMGATGGKATDDAATDAGGGDGGGPR
jgi:Na+/proline symporter